MAISFSTFACNTTCLKYDPTQRPSFHFHILLCVHDLQLQQHKRVDFYITFSRCFNVSLSWLSLVLPIATTKSKKASSPAFCPGEPSFEIKMKILINQFYLSTSARFIPELSRHGNLPCLHQAPQHSGFLPLCLLQLQVLNITDKGTPVCCCSKPTPLLCITFVR